MTNNLNHIQTVNNGVIENTRPTNTSNKSNVSNDSLGKDAFLQLLVTQLKYQDPLNPTEDTEFIGQLAQFSQLETMQNLSQSFTNTQAFSLVGKEVVLKVSDSANKQTFVTGKVDYVTIDNGKAYVTINENSYSIDDLYHLVDEDYIPESMKDEVEIQELEG